MGLIIGSNYINFKTVKKERGFKPLFETITNEEGVEVMTPILDNNGEQLKEDTLLINVMLNIYPDETNREYRQSVWVQVDMPYNPSISDSDIYNLLKTKSDVVIKDGFGRDIILDLTKAEDC